MFIRIELPEIAADNSPAISCIGSNPLRKKDAAAYFKGINSKDAFVPARTGYELGVLVESGRSSMDSDPTASREAAAH